MIETVELESKDNIKKIKHYVEGIKFYLPLFLIVPPLLGGVWQLVELSKLSPSFIRFFSATQLLPDGLLVLLVMITFLPFLIFFITSPFDKTQFRKHKLLTTVRPSDFSHTSIRLIQQDKVFYNSHFSESEMPFYKFSIFMLPIMIIVFYKYFYQELITNFSLMYLIFVTFTTLILIIGYILIFYTLFVYYEEHKIIRKIKEISRINYIQNIFSVFYLMLFGTIVLSFVFVPILFFSLFHDEYVLPDKLKNLEYISDKLDNNDYNSSEISYLNDKYCTPPHKLDQT